MQNSTTCQNELLYAIGLTLIDNIGPIKAKKLINYCGSPEHVFQESSRNLQLINGIGSVMAKSILNANVLKRAEEELNFIESNNIRAYYYQEKEYPTRLKRCSDAPVVLYAKGTLSFNTEKIISIVGTRKASSAGKEFTKELVYSLKQHNVTIVSGLAYGIDIVAHRSAYDSGLQTIATMAHGLDMVYPATHKKTANLIQENGGLISDFPSGVKPDRERFPSRNRIVAGISDATIVIESKRKGGSLITADMADSYHRDVFAVPGAPGTENKEGCNSLIKSNKAALLESVSDLEYILGWDQTTHNQLSEKELMLTPEEEMIYHFIKDQGIIAIDDIVVHFDLMMSSVSMMLLNLELKGAIQSLPGKKYKST